MPPHTMPPTPPLDENVRRLLAVIDQMPIRVPERDRVINALETVAPGEWLRVRMELDREQLLGLSRPALWFTPDELAHVLEAATTVARIYGFETVGVGHVAVALAATSRQTGGVIDTMAEAFGLGTLENSRAIFDHHLRWMESADRRDTDGTPAEEEGASVEQVHDGPVYGANVRGVRVHRAATFTHLGLRAAAFCVLAAVAVRTGDPLVWPFAVASLLTARDTREPGLVLGGEVSPYQIRTRRPWLGCLAVAAVVLGLPAPAGVIVAEYLLLDVVSCLGVRMVSERMVIESEPASPVSRYIGRLPTAVDGFSTRRRRRRLWLVLFVAVAPVTVLAAVAARPYWPLFALVALFAARRWTVFALVTSGIAVVLSTGPAWLLLVAWTTGLLARAMIAWSDRAPYAMIPFPGPRGRSVHARAYRLVQVGRPAAALRLLDTADGTEAHRLTALRSWALLQSGRPGEAKNVLRSGGGVDDRTRALILCLAELELADAGAADRALKAFGGVDEDMPETLYRMALIARIRLTLLNGGAKTLTDGVAMGVPHKVGRADVLFVVTLLGLAAESALASEPRLAYLLAHFGVRLSLPDAYETPGGFIDRRRPMALEHTRCVIQRGLADLRWRGADTETVTEIENAIGHLMRMDRPTESAGFLNVLAGGLKDAPGYRAAVIRGRTEALAMLNATRHRLGEAEDRRRYWRVYGRTIEDAMSDAVAGGDWEILAELVESARLQLGPHKAAGFDSSWSAPFIRVRGTSRVEQAGWYQPGERPPAYALEDIAALVLGPGTWWWSTWSTETALYWAVIPPEGALSGGRLPLHPGSEPYDVLAELRDALPIQRTGEDEDAFEERVLSSPLLTGPAEAESALARRLGHLLPAPLTEALRNAPEPFPVAIAPAERLANVPWASVEIPAETPDDVRLVERCVAAIAPPASLLAAIAARPRGGDAAPVSLAVIDPGSGPDGTEEWPPLPTARRLLDVLPADLPVIGPHDHVSAEGLAARLRELDGGTSAVFICHTAEDAGSAAGLVLRPSAPGRKAELLTADLLIGDPSRFPMPAQVLLLACESADLRKTGAGEWLVLGPAMLWAGADRTIVTGFPVVDTAEGQDRDDVIDGHLLRLLTEGRPLAEGLRDVQLRRLAQWRESRRRPPEERRSAPMHWAGHLAMGAFARSRPEVLQRPARRQLVHRTVPGLLDDAAEVALRAGRPLITLRDLVFVLALYGFEDELPRWRRTLIHALAYPYSAASLIRPRRRDRSRRAAPSPQVEELLRSASEAARTARHRVVEVEHVLVAVLAAPGPAGRFTRAMSGWDTRQPEVVKMLLGDTQYGYQFVGLPELNHLDPAALPATYATMGAEVPDAEDGELRLLAER